jgi:hypothetical protein
MLIRRMNLTLTHNYIIYVALLNYLIINTLCNEKNRLLQNLRTKIEVRQFEKDYTVVDRKIVENLVTNFVQKQ